MDLKELSNIDPSKHWYYQVKFRAVLSQILRCKPDFLNLVDVGAGSGFFSIEMAKHRPEINVVCVDSNYLTERTTGKITYTKKATPLVADVYLMMDVLEHVENDQELLQNSTSKAPQGSLLVVTVPAFNCLWSPHDDFLGHFRRYRLKEVAELVESSGFRVIQKSYLFASIFPIVYLVRLISKKKYKSSSNLVNHSKFTNYFLQKILNYEHKYFPNKLFGVSALVVASKK